MPPPKSPPAPRVLIVDDNPGTTAGLVADLRQRGYEVRTAGTPLDVVRALAGWTPDAAIADPAAAAGGGLAAAEALAGADRPPLLIAFLRPDRAASVPRAKLALFNQAFTKAASAEAIGDAIAQHLARRTLRLEG
jgi:CheY-like chemotaxis protein